ncbi:hypothetical protein FHS83_002739 [Rhizomicrobium palustre]|uniref:Pyridoxamine 5'-phosphate oxidase N-terminal domain-containing protein n=1 Tax=Rhizomicrobium palustre TaxID=189966 RepID=A0A846N289_9PROT|nr:pyridoxamine 5'-phosphate oxidase family protein [Rhizomicrobium palustre]NIK89421.1 hypothetical protein [Rhizomicrobium palustre]
MGKKFGALSEEHRDFIARQKIFFVATAAETGRVSLSPKGMDSFAVLSPNRVLWLNVTGSGNETSAHVQVNPRMTIMFCAFEGKPVILRIFGIAKAVHKGDQQWKELIAHFPPLPGARQIFDVTIEMVQTSCGMSVPFFDYSSEREQLNDWARGKGDDGIRRYWEQKNQTSIDGLPTNILEKSR